MKTKDEDFVEHLFVGTTHNYIMFFSNLGKAYWKKIHELPQGGRASRGRPIVNLLPLEQGERIEAMIPVAEFSPDWFLVMCTRNGQVVRNSLELYSNPRKVGIKAINIADGDELIAVRLTQWHPGDRAGDAEGDGGAVPRVRRACDGPVRGRRSRHHPRQG